MQTKPHSWRIKKDKVSTQTKEEEKVKNMFLSTNSAPQVHCFDQSRNTIERVGISCISNLVLKDPQGLIW